MSLASLSGTSPFPFITRTRRKDRFCLMATGMCIDCRPASGDLRALEEFIARRRQRRLLDLMGKLEWDRSFDVKAERSRK